jgi:hypothetical protein
MRPFHNAFFGGGEAYGDVRLFAAAFKGTFEKHA